MSSTALGAESDYFYALHCERQRVAKTLSFMVDSHAVLVVAAGDAKIDNPKYKAQFGTKAKMLSQTVWECPRACRGVEIVIFLTVFKVWMKISAALSVHTQP